MSITCPHTITLPANPYCLPSSVKSAGIDRRHLDRVFTEERPPRPWDAFRFLVAVGCVSKKAGCADGQMGGWIWMMSCDHLKQIVSKRALVSNNACTIIYTSNIYVRPTRGSVVTCADEFHRQVRLDLRWDSVSNRKKSTITFCHSHCTTSLLNNANSLGHPSTRRKLPARGSGWSYSTGPSSKPHSLPRKVKAEIPIRSSGRGDEYQKLLADFKESRGGSQKDEWMMHRFFLKKLRRRENRIISKSIREKNAIFKRISDLCSQLKGKFSPPSIYETQTPCERHRLVIHLESRILQTEGKYSHSQYGTGDFGSF
ncbi:hypothetical protein CEXT_54281 [Caerostris extrusa]|uniref:Uncharacterized protein n=1 Tax=Caerostris extrusa TaxID=172846 RepID=A0AAV4QLU3_CAEEX|nr:hypothetical protein CEXT_54281 [Caerostris extrusa]